MAEVKLVVEAAAAAAVAAMVNPIDQSLTHGQNDGHVAGLTPTEPSESKASMETWILEFAEDPVFSKLNEYYPTVAKDYAKYLNFTAKKKMGAELNTTEMLSDDEAKRIEELALELFLHITTREGDIQVYIDKVNADNANAAAAAGLGGAGPIDPIQQVRLLCLQLGKMRRKIVVENISIDEVFNTTLDSNAISAAFAHIQNAQILAEWLDDDIDLNVIEECVQLDIFPYFDWDQIRNLSKIYKPEELKVFQKLGIRYDRINLFLTANVDKNLLLSYAKHYNLIFYAADNDLIDALYIKLFKRGLDPLILKALMETTFVSGKPSSLEDVEQLCGEFSLDAIATAVNLDKYQLPIIFDCYRKGIKDKTVSEMHALGILSYPNSLTLLNYGFEPVQIKDFQSNHGFPLILCMEEKITAENIYQAFQASIPEFYNLMLPKLLKDISVVDLKSVPKQVRPRLLGLLHDTQNRNINLAKTFELYRLGFLEIQYANWIEALDLLEKGLEPSDIMCIARKTFHRVLLNNLNDEALKLVKDLILKLEFDSPDVHNYGEDFIKGFAVWLQVKLKESKDETLRFVRDILPTLKPYQIKGLIEKMSLEDVMDDGFTRGTTYLLKRLKLKYADIKHLHPCQIELLERFGISEEKAQKGHQKPNKVTLKQITAPWFTLAHAEAMMDSKFYYDEIEGLNNVELNEFLNKQKSIPFPQLMQMRKEKLAKRKVEAESKLEADNNRVAGGDSVPSAELKDDLEIVLTETEAFLNDPATQGMTFVPMPWPLPQPLILSADGSRVVNPGELRQAEIQESAIRTEEESANRTVAGAGAAAAAS